MIRDLEEGRSPLHDRHGSLQDRGGRDRVKQEIARLGVTYGLVSSETSFVAVEERKTPVQDPAVLRRVPIALTRGWGGREDTRSIMTRRRAARSATPRSTDENSLPTQPFVPPSCLHSWQLHLRQNLPHAAVFPTGCAGRRSTWQLPSPVNPSVRSTGSSPSRALTATGTSRRARGDPGAPADRARASDAVRFRRPEGGSARVGYGPGPRMARGAARALARVGAPGRKRPAEWLERCSAATDRLEELAEAADCIGKLHVGLRQERSCRGARVVIDASIIGVATR